MSNPRLSPVKFPCRSCDEFAHVNITGRWRAICAPCAARMAGDERRRASIRNRARRMFAAMFKPGAG